MTKCNYVNINNLMNFDYFISKIKFVLDSFSYPFKVKVESNRIQFSDLLTVTVNVIVRKSLLVLLLILAISSEKMSQSV